MAHMTKVNGTAYEIVGGSTKVNGTDYDIIKGKTTVGGTNYDIEFASGFTWNGWNNATWQDVYQLCLAVESGEMDQFPNDVVVGASKLVDFHNNQSSSYYGSVANYTHYAYIFKVDNTNGQLVLLLNLGNLSQTWGYNGSNYSQKYSGSKLKNICDYLTSSVSWGTGSQKFNLSYIIPQTRTTVYATGLTLTNAKRDTISNQYFFVPTGYELRVDSGCDAYNSTGITQGLYNINEFKNSGVNLSFWTASQYPYNSSTCRGVFVSSTSSGSTTQVNLGTGKKVCVMCVIGGR